MVATCVEFADPARVRRPLRHRRGILMNSYEGIADCYDLLMRAGYYDHEAMARAADAVIDEHSSVLELGVGTGLFAQSLTDTTPACEITGVDFTPSMLEIAQERVGDDVELIQADVTSMDLGRTFDTAISSGGVWVVIRDDDEIMLGTHLDDCDDEVRGLQNVNRHLEPDGSLLLSIQDMHRDLSQELDDGVVYSQRLSRTDQPDDEHFMIEKQYCFTRGPEVIAEETLHLGFYRRTAMDRILDDAGFASDGVDDAGRFFVYGKAPVGAGSPT
jgi:ubiquinone/menaquinone biosynthesis C-methylase UbiE